jgi:hypothetical protein
VRVITRTLHKMRQVVGNLRFRDRTRSVGRRVLEIAEQSSKLGERSASGSEGALSPADGDDASGAGEAQKAVGQAKRRAKKLAPQVRQRVQGLAQQAKQMSELTRRVLEQTKARVLKGDTHHPHKVLSVFETHTEVIRRGKKVKPTEFGKLVKVKRRRTNSSPITRSVPNGCRTGNFGSPAWSAMNRSSEARRTWPPPTRLSVRRPTNKWPRHEGCAACHRCAEGACRRPDGRIKSNAGFGGRCAGAPAARGESVPSNDGTGCTAVAIGESKEWSAGWDWG